MVMLQSNPPPRYVRRVDVTSPVGPSRYTVPKQATNLQGSLYMTMCHTTGDKDRKQAASCGTTSSNDGRSAGSPAQHDSMILQKAGCPTTSDAGSSGRTPV
eukprot:m.150529 g.150529  ORF g.150529 m.150529 type:complete len:101 (-) comp11683_c1_seq2:3478-3780(-)